MSNLSYCRFENTLSALQDCYDSMDDEITGTELVMRNRLIKLCTLISAEYDEDAS